VTGASAPDASTSEAASEAQVKLNANQAGAVESRLAYLDQLFAQLDQLARGSHSPFARERNDFTPDEAALVQAFVSRARTALVAALDMLGIARPIPSGSARWSATTTLTFADITAGEMTGSFLRGYGPVDPQAGRAVEAVARQLRAIIADGKALLHEQDIGGLADRLTRLRGPVGEVLRIVDEVSTAHRLAGVRPLIAAAADRAEDTLFAVGIFGRVSAGKSSLIDALLGSDVLPVGATPVTAVPVSIEPGAESAVVDFASGKQTPILISELSSYVTEQGNPDNVRGVRAVRIGVPTAPAGVRFLDTPGVGSLAGGGPARTFAWLPRCDLGLILVAAGTPVGRDELALVSGLVNAGIACRVLLSKADLLTDSERRAAVDYVQQDLARALGPETVPPVMAVSVRPDERVTLDTLRREVLEPLAADHVAHTRTALLRRLRNLVRTTAVAVRAQTSAAGTEAGSTRAGARTVVPADETAGVDAALQRVRAITDELARAAPRIINEAVEQVVNEWEHGESGRAGARAAIIGAVGGAIARVRATVAPDASDGRGNDAAADERMPPLFDADLLDTIPALDPPLLAPGGLRRRSAAHKLAAIEPALNDALDRYAARLAAWGTARVERRAESASHIPAVSNSTANGAGSDAGVAAIPELARAERLIDTLERERDATPLP
jgi:GTP-binding protein EngB required for normal cell division